MLLYQNVQIFKYHNIWKICKNNNNNKKIFLDKHLKVVLLNFHVHLVKQEKSIMDYYHINKNYKN